ncbi:DUF5996 family protein [Raoultibacter phocaeensis]|uniref:DUF5996 family protein n=1 Tax=Raoultibacter phocaeensis TaxID=2479841 RepID=UPI001119506E|nr:DUF5996 family protein [Raoultibacter phocaeensis]
MKALPYSSWSSTAETVHLVSQMLGKFKLDKMPAQPEWQQVTLPLTATGFTTGLVPCEKNACSISIDLFASTVTATSTDGSHSSFELRDQRSIAQYYDEFKRMLDEIGIDTAINPAPQEMDITTPFDENTETRRYDARAAREGFDMFAFAYRAILGFMSGYRCKSALPSLFWGTFDVTGVLYSGKPAPYPGNGIIEQVAFDEELIEFGFWPGDSAEDNPSFFVLPYPFVEEDLSGTLSASSAGFYSLEKAEYFLPLEKALERNDPEAEVRGFFEEAFHTLIQRGGWEQKDWYTEPLLV